ncbi:MAG: hypothetical protein ABIE42_02460 [Candidatus Eisenbacteria bacterium]
MVVGVVWLLMIAFELSEGRTPGFLLVMVAVIAGIQFGFYYYYARDREVRWVGRVHHLGDRHPRPGVPAPDYRAPVRPPADNQSGWMVPVMVLNSALWACVAYLVARAARRRAGVSEELASGPARFTRISQKKLSLDLDY